MTEEVTEEAPQTTDDLLRQLLSEQQQHRAEVAQLREEIAKQKNPIRTVAAVSKSAEELLADRLAEIAQHSHYCPGCGRLYNYLRECRGSGESPHPAIDVVPTDELHTNDPTQHTPAPNTDELG